MLKNKNLRRLNLHGFTPKIIILIGIIVLISSFVGCGTNNKKEIEYDIVVAQDGSGDFKNIRDAIDSIPSGNNERVLIYIKNGYYNSYAIVEEGQNKISLIGESRENTIISTNNPASLGSAQGSATLKVKGDDFTAENITFENAYGRGSQALAAYVEGDRAVFKNCGFLGYQDTLNVESRSEDKISRSYFEDCYIEGDVDFIYGTGRAVFYKCEIKSLVRDNKKGGYITAADTLKSNEYGLVFIDCKLTSDNKNESVDYLGRAYGPDGNVIFKNCYMGAHIKKEGWTDMKYNAANARFYEYKNTGPGAAVNDTRRQLSDSEADKITIENILSGSDNWDPREPVY